AHPDDLEQFDAARARGFADGTAWETETRFRNKSGDYRWFLVRVTPLLAEDGRVLRWYFTGTDIEDRKKAEERARQDERDLRTLVDSSPGMLLVANAEGIQQYCNKRTSDFLGKEPIDFTERDAESRAFYVYENLHPDDLLPLANAWMRSQRAGEALDFHYRL